MASSLSVPHCRLPPNLSMSSWCGDSARLWEDQKVSSAPEQGVEQIGQDLLEKKAPLPGPGMGSVLLVLQGADVGSPCKEFDCKLK